jgi:hypothetical protein
MGEPKLCLPNSLFDLMPRPNRIFKFNETWLKNEANELEGGIQGIRSVIYKRRHFLLKFLTQAIASLRLKILSGNMFIISKF